MNQRTDVSNFYKFSQTEADIPVACVKQKTIMQQEGLSEGGGGLPPEICTSGLGVLTSQQKLMGIEILVHFGIWY